MIYSKTVMTVKYQKLRENTLPLLIIIYIYAWHTWCKDKQKESENKSNISNLVKNSGLNTKFKILETKALEIKAESNAGQDKIVKLQTHNLSYFLGKILFGDNGSLNKFVYQPILDILELKKTRALILFLIGIKRDIFF